MGFWFFIDIFVVLPDWVFWILERTLSVDGGGGDAAADSASLVRVFRAVRVLRLLRLAKLKRLLQRLNDRITNEIVFLTLYIGQLTVALVLINHFLGSIWYLVGEIGRMNEDDNWISVHSVR